MESAESRSAGDITTLNVTAAAPAAVPSHQAHETPDPSLDSTASDHRLLLGAPATVRVIQGMCILTFREAAAPGKTKRSILSAPQAKGKYGFILAHHPTLPKAAHKTQNTRHPT